MLVSIIRFDGFCHQTADQAFIDNEAANRNTLLRALSDSRFAIYSHIVRRHILPAIDGSLLSISDRSTAVHASAFEHAHVFERALPHGRSPWLSGQGGPRRQDAVQVPQGEPHKALMPVQGSGTGPCSRSRPGSSSRARSGTTVLLMMATLTCSAVVMMANWETSAD